MAKVNVIEEMPQQSRFKNRIHTKREFKKNKKAYFYCNKVKHFKKNYRLYLKEKRKKKRKGFSNSKKDTFQVHVTEEVLIVVISKVNMVGHDGEW